MLVLKVRTVASLLFVAAAAVLLSTTALLKVAAEMGVEFPDWLAVDVERSAIEGRNYAQFPNITWKRFIGEKFQSELEKYVSDAVPMRDSVLLGNAALQRGSIAMANALFGYAAYHTFYGSERIYLPDSDALMRVPLKQVTDYREIDMGERLDAVASGLASVAERFPEKRFVLFVVDHSYTSAANPTFGLTSDFWTTSDVVDRLNADLCGIQNVSIIARPLSRQDDFLDEYVMTDHHWNIVGAVRACNLILDELGRGLFAEGELLTVGSFSGTNARSGLYLREEMMHDSNHDFSGLELVTAAGDSEAGNQHSLYYGAMPEERLTNSYGLWYGQSDSYVEIHADGSGGVCWFPTRLAMLFGGR